MRESTFGPTARPTRSKPDNLRTPAEVEQYFDMVELVEPGLVRTTEWRPDLQPADLPDLENLAGVGRKTH